MTAEDGLLRVSTAGLIRTSARWALWSFGDHPRDTRDAYPKVLRYTVPEPADVAGVTPYSPPNEPLSLDLTALVRVDEDGDLVDSGRVEVALAVVGVGDVMPLHDAPNAGPRLLAAHPWRRATWVYYLGSQALIGAGSIYSESFHPRTERSS